MKALLILTTLLSSVGCASAYTSIQPAGDNTFFVTKTEQGFFKVSGTLYSCKANGKSMVCTEIDSR
jgi:hypothetical protein